MKALSIEKRPPDVSKIVSCTINCNDTFWPVAFVLAFYREGFSKKYHLRCYMCFVVYGVTEDFIAFGLTSFEESSHLKTPVVTG